MGGQKQVIWPLFSRFSPLKHQYTEVEVVVHVGCLKPQFWSLGNDFLVRRNRETWAKNPKTRFFLPQKVFILWSSKEQNSYLHNANFSRGNVTVLCDGTTDWIWLIFRIWHFYAILWENGEKLFLALNFEPLDQTKQNFGFTKHQIFLTGPEKDNLVQHH